MPRTLGFVILVCLLPGWLLAAETSLDSSLIPGQVRPPLRAVVRDPAEAAALDLDGDEYEEEDQEEELTVTVRGTEKNGRVRITRVHVKDGKAEFKAATVEGVPAKYRAKARELVQRMEKHVKQWQAGKKP